MGTSTVDAVAKMATYELVLGIILMVISLALVVFVLFQSGKDKNLSGAISGAADTFFGKGRASTMDRILNKITVALCAIFMVLVLVMYCIVSIPSV